MFAHGFPSILQTFNSNKSHVDESVLFVFKKLIVSEIFKKSLCKIVVLNSLEPNLKCYYIGVS